MKTGEAWETLVILAAIASVWPRYILGWQHWVWQAIPLLMLGLLLMVCVRRLRRGKRGRPVL